MLGTHQIVTTVLLVYTGQIYHCTEEKTDNVFTHYGITVFDKSNKDTLLSMLVSGLKDGWMDG